MLHDENWLREQLAIYGTAAAVADAWGLGERTVQRAARKLRKKDLSQSIGQLPRFFESSDLMQEVRIDGTGTNAGTGSADWHLPITNYAVAEDLVENAIRYDATKWLVIAGDFFNFDALSDYYPKQDTAGLEQELWAASEVVSRLLDVFDRVVITKGNHDIRLLKALGFKLKFEHAITQILNIDKGKLERLTVTGRDYVIVETELGEWRICHTKQYAKASLAVPARIADRYQQHVAGAHRHHHAIGFSPSGKMIVELGGLHDESRTEYLQEWSTDFPKWQPGYMLLHQGSPYLPMLAPAPR